MYWLSRAQIDGKQTFKARQPLIFHHIRYLFIKNMSIYVLSLSDSLCVLPLVSLFLFSPHLFILVYSIECIVSFKFFSAFRPIPGCNEIYVSCPINCTSLKVLQLNNKYGTSSAFTNLCLIITTFSYLEKFKLYI